MKYKHTPGPWRAVDKRPNCAGFSIFSGSQYIGFIGDSDSKTNCAGNAHLIAAAPEMLEALERAANSAGFQYMTYETREIIDAALTKAKGE